jgi:hypothetical protein
MEAEAVWRYKGISKAAAGSVTGIWGESTRRTVGTYNLGSAGCNGGSFIRAGSQEDLARTAAGGLSACATAGQLCAATAALVLSPLYTHLSSLPIATTNAAGNSTDVYETRIQRLPLQHACGCASSHCQWLRRSTTAGKCSL